MKIAIASDDGKTIAGHLGRARGFIIYDVEGGSVKNRIFLDNTFTGHAAGLRAGGDSRHGEGGAGCGHGERHGAGERPHHGALQGAGHGEHHGEHHGHGPVLRALAGCQAVISHGMGRRIYADLQAAGIEAYVVNESDADEALKLYLSKTLENHPERGCDH